jgi:hypothetical protein
MCPDIGTRLVERLLSASPSAVSEIRSYLLRLRLARFVAALALRVLGTAALLTLHLSLGVLCARSRTAGAGPGASAFEACLRTLSLRGLPLAADDLQRDTVQRVASSRTATAAALGFGYFSLVDAWVLTARGPVSLLNESFVGSLLMTAGPAAATGVICLVQPVRAWRPRSA